MNKKPIHKKIQIYDLIQNARSGIDKGTDADLAIVLLVDKYNKVFRTTDETLEQSLRTGKKLTNLETINFLKVFTAYDSLLNSLMAKNTKERDSIIHERLIWILSRTILLLYKMEYITGVNRANKTANIKNIVKNKAEKIWRKHNLGQDEAAVADLRRLYEQEIGKKLIRPSTRWIREEWMVEWRKNPG